MKRIEDISEITEARRRLRQLHSDKVTNLTAFPQEIKGWLEQGKLHSVIHEDCVLYFREREAVNSLYFMGPDYATVEERIAETLAKEYTEDGPLITEILDRSEMLSLPFPELMTLTRMTRLGKTEFIQLSEDGISYLSSADASLIREILIENFDPVCENIPTKEEIGMLAEEGTIVGFIQEGRIEGLMVCERDKTTIHLRYWWVSEKMRNRGVGSKLLNEFFRLGEATTRQILWVDIRNQNAIMRYEHYGFEKELIFDHIYLIKK